MAFFSAKHLGAGQYYLMTIRDKDGEPLDGSGTYRLNVPANAPVKQYWSATVYDRETHALSATCRASSRSSTHARLAEERRRLGGHLFRPQGAGGQGSRTGCRPSADGQVRSAVPLSTARRSRSSTRRGCCRTSRRSSKKARTMKASLRAHRARCATSASTRRPQAPSGTRAGHRR